MELEVVFDNFSITKRSESLWLEAILKCSRHMGIDALIVYKFVSDDEMLAHNLAFLNHDTLTDILTFDLRDSATNEVNILISVDRVHDNAAAFNTSFDRELFRVMCHGLLHICGQADKTEDESKAMRKSEDELIEMFHVEP